MKRRHFITYTGMAGVGLLVSCKNQSPEIAKVLLDVEEITISEIQELFTSGALTSEELVKRYLERIENIDKNGPAINSIIEINPDALAIAKKMDEERLAGKVRGPLHGIPIVIKDNIDTGDQMETTAGSLAMQGHKAQNDAPVVKMLRDAGMVLMGKTNLSEWANFRSTKSVSGWSSRGGQTLNPYVLSQNPCGSSSGSGAAIAANLCTVAIGTETDGSVTCPAAVCGIVGIKPTIGLVSRTGIIPISHSQDTAGPMARTVADAAALLNIMVGYDPQDQVTSAARDYQNVDYTQYLKLDGLEGKRIGFDATVSSEDPLLNEIRNNLVVELEQAGATVIDVSFFKRIGSIGDDEYEVFMYEFKDGLNKYLAGTNAPVKSLAEVIEYNQVNNEKAMPHFQQEILESSQEKGDLNSARYKELVKKNKKIAQETIDEVLSENNLDALVDITIGPGCDIDYENGDKWADIYSPPAAAIAGYAHITVPGGFYNELPIGISIFSGAFSEGKLIEIAYGYEQNTKHRKKPKYLPEKGS